MTAPTGRLGILAGRGELPWAAAREALRQGDDVRIFPFMEEDPPPDLEPYAERIVLTRFYSSTLRTLRKHNVQRVLVIGKATRDLLYKKPRFDLRTLWLLARMVSQSDYSLFANVARVVEDAGMQIMDQDSYLQHLFLKPGRYGKRLSAREMNDVVFGMEHAREINRLDIGQTVVVGKTSVLAVEAAEGTDETIRRGGKLFHGKGAVVCKLAKEDHDRRFDIPTTGDSTLASMLGAGCRVLSFDARDTFVVHPAEFIARAKKDGITIFVVDSSRTIDLAYVKKWNAKEARYSER